MTNKELSKLYHLKKEIEMQRKRLYELENIARSCTARITGLPHSKEISANMLRKLYDLRGYASGTLSLKKGLATVDENGKEIILYKSSPGRYRLMNEEDVVFSHEATKKL